MTESTNNPHGGPEMGSGSDDSFAWTEPEQSTGGAGAQAREWLAQVQSRAPARAGLQPPRVPWDPASAVSERPGGFLAQYEGLMGMHPAVRRRLARLVLAGATPSAPVS